ncbi:hypothetical protein Tco_0793113 [Tanacetum coccineum]
MVVETKVASKDVNLSVDEVTLAQALSSFEKGKTQADKEQAHTPTVSSTTTIPTQMFRDKRGMKWLVRQKRRRSPTIVSWDRTVQANDRLKIIQMAQQMQEYEEAREGSSKEHEKDTSTISIKNEQKVDEDKETTELQRLIEVVPDKEEVAIDAIPLATKPPSIVDWKIHKEGKKSY